MTRTTFPLHHIFDPEKTWLHQPYSSTNPHRRLQDSSVDPEERTSDQKTSSTTDWGFQP